MDKDFQPDVRGSTRCSEASGRGSLEPFGESESNGPEDGAREAVHRLAAKPDRDPKTGRFLAGNTAAGKTLSRSEAFWSAVSAVKRELVERLKSDFAADAGAATTMEGILDGYAEARLLRHAMFNRLAEQGGPVTGKGRARALFRAYLAALDRETRLALVLGLERRPGRVPTLNDVLSDGPLPVAERAKEGRPDGDTGEPVADPVRRRGEGR